MNMWMEIGVLALALYGLFALLLQVRSLWFSHRADLGQSSFSVLLIERDQGGSMEWFVRGLMGFFSGLPPGVEAELVVVDCGSAEATREILSKLSRLFPSMTVCLSEHSLILDGDLSTSAELELGYFLCQHPIVVVVEALDGEPSGQRLQALLGFIRHRRLELSGRISAPNGQGLVG